MSDAKQTTHFPGLHQRYAGYDRIMGNVFWLLIALVTLNIRLMPKDHTSIYFLAGFCILLFLYNLNARYGFFAKRYGPKKTFVDLMVFLAFIISVCWHTGRLTSPFISLMYLILMAAALTQGKRVTYLVGALAIISYILLASAEFRGINDILTRILELFPFMLIAHFGAMLSGESESARREVERLSLTDDVTGTNNMRNFFLLAEAQERISLRYNRPFSICMIDADDLKAINDRYGHLAGTELIRQMARVITSNIRSSDICARYGGDEFVIMFTETDRHKTVPVVERIVARMATMQFDFEGNKLSTTLSAGVAGYPEDGTDVRTIMANADQAMYVSKRTGKNRVTLYSKNGMNIPPAAGK